MPKAFISHAIRDRDLVEQRLRAPLHRFGVETWFCEHDIEPGNNWVARINQGLVESDWFVLALTPRSIESLYVLAELQTAVNLTEEKKKPQGWIIPVVLETCQPAHLHPLLTILQQVDFTVNPSAAVRRLAMHFGVPDLVAVEPVRFPPPRAPAASAPAIKIAPITNVEESEPLQRALSWMETCVARVAELAHLGDEVARWRGRLEHDSPLVVLLRGDHRRGKTTLFHALADGPPREANETTVLRGSIQRLGVTLLDLPGDFAGNPAAEDTLWDADLVLFVLSATELGSSAEINELQRLRERGFPAILVVCNKMDAVRPRDVQRLREYAQNRCGPKLAFGADGLFFIAAAKALEARETGVDAPAGHGNLEPLYEALALLAGPQKRALLAWRVAHHVLAVLRESVAPAVSRRRSHTALADADTFTEPLDTIESDLEKFLAQLPVPLPREKSTSTEFDP